MRVTQGWTKFYEFSLGDLRSGTGVVELAAKIAKGGGEMDWDYIRGLMVNSVHACWSLELARLLHTKSMFFALKFARAFQRPWNVDD